MSRFALSGPQGTQLGCDYSSGFQPWTQTGPTGLGEECSFSFTPFEIKRLNIVQREDAATHPPLAPCLFPPPSRTPAPRKDPPWITLVQAEPKKKPAPLPPSSSPGPPSRRGENGGVEEVAQQSQVTAGLEPKPYNPFEEEEEEEEEAEPRAAPSLAPGPAPAHSESTPKALHPWYGITPTSSPKTKKRPAPRAPSASPLGECHLWEPSGQNFGSAAWLRPGPGEGGGGGVQWDPCQATCVLSEFESKPVR